MDADWPPAASNPQLVASGDELLAPGAQHRAEVRIEAPSMLWWTFQTRDPARTLQFRIEDANPSAEHTMPQAKYNCLAHPVRGNQSIGAGTYVFVFDNRESTFKKKPVSYKIFVTPAS